MRWRALSDTDDEREFVLVFETGDAVVETLRSFAREHDVTAGSFRAIGAFRRATLAYFAWETKRYEALEVEEQVEVASLSGDVTREGSEVRVHAHCVLGRRDGSAVAGHLREATVRPTLELFLRAWPVRLCRGRDEESGLALIQPDET